MAANWWAGGLKGVGLLVLGGLIGYWGASPSNKPAATPAATPAAATSAARGAQLVALGGCDDCHTPKRADGTPDLNRRFIGYEASAPLPTPTDGVSINNQLTAWRGPWGLSLSRNITPDPETGIGNWSLAQFKQTMRSGTDPAGKTLLPPMPSAALGSLPDSDLEAIYNYLRTVKPIVNQVTGP